MTTVGQRERATQQRVVRFFIEELGYRYLGDWHTRPNNRNVEPDLLSHWLIDRGVPICSPYTQTIGQDRLPGGTVHIQLNLTFLPSTHKRSHTGIAR